MEHLDLSYDEQFASRPSLPWLPWVGKDFAASPVRTMVLGDSVYEWNPETMHATRLFSAPTGLRELHTACALGKREAKYVRNVERAVYMASRPRPDQKARLWGSVIYHELVLEVLANKNTVPEPEQFDKGWSETLDLWELLGIEQCLVYGVRSAKSLKAVCKSLGLPCTVRELDFTVGKSCAPRYGTVTLGSGKKVRVLFVRHPSRFSWKGWGPVMREHLSLSFLHAA